MSVANVLPTQVLKVTQMFAVVFALLMMWAIMPAPARAAGLTDTQMQAVINLLSSFGTDQATLDNVGLALKGASKDDILKAMGNDSSTLKQRAKEAGEKLEKFKDEFPGASACGMLERNLMRGSMGDDVTQLQDFLQQTGDLALGSTTNFFGPATERALQAWQARMGLANNGDASSTGFGAVGPKTRAAIMMHCKEKHQDGQASSTQPLGASNTGSPVCVLKASKTSIQNGESVTLVWDSKNATYASSVNGDKGPVRGSIKVAPTETTTYVKRVYSPTGEGQCTATIMVGEDTTPAAEQKVVIVPTTLNIGRVVSLMGSGMAAVMDGYLGLFGMSLE